LKVLPITLLATTADFSNAVNDLLVKSMFLAVLPKSFPERSASLPSVRNKAWVLAIAPVSDLTFSLIVTLFSAGIYTPHHSRKQTIFCLLLQPVLRDLAQ
jgi:hypothetical protein